MRDVDADSAGTDDRDSLADATVAQQHVGVRDHVREVAAGNRDAAWENARCEHDAIEAAQRRRIGDASSEPYVDAQARELVGEVANRLVEIAFAGNAPRHAKLAPELAGGLKEHDAMPEFGERTGALDPGRPGADHRKPAPSVRRS